MPVGSCLQICQMKYVQGEQLTILQDLVFSFISKKISKKAILRSISKFAQMCIGLSDPDFVGLDQHLSPQEVNHNNICRIEWSNAFSDPA